MCNLQSLTGFCCDFWRRGHAARQHEAHIDGQALGGLQHTRTPHFECGPIDHSGISPVVSACKCTNYFLSFDISSIKKADSPHFFATSKTPIREFHTYLLHLHTR